MSSTVDNALNQQPRVSHTPAIALVPFGLSLSIFLAISFLLCAVGDFIPWLQNFHLLEALYPGVDWTRPEMIAAGAVWAFFTGWYVALGFGSLYNFFVAKAR
jgi:hypothetical protein